MSGHLKCAECERKFKKLYDDPRTPPLDEGPCLCHECTEISLEEVIETLEEELKTIKDDYSNHCTQEKFRN